MAELEADLDAQARQGMYLAIYLVQVKQEYEDMAQSAADRDGDPGLFTYLMKPWTDCERDCGGLDMSNPTDYVEPEVFLAFRKALIRVRNRIGMGAKEAKEDTSIEFSNLSMGAFHLYCDRHTVVCPDCGKEIDVAKCGKPAEFKDKRDKNK